MKKLTFNYLVFFLVVSVVLSSCGGLQQMADRANEVKYNVTPKVLEMHAEQVPLKITGTFPAKYFDKKAVLVITPILKYEGGEKVYKSITVIGESVNDNVTKIPYATGGSIKIEDTIPYIDAMRISELELRIGASSGDKKAPFVNRSIAIGVITTPRLVTKGLMIDSKGTGIGQTIMATITLPTQSFDQSSAMIYYALQKYNLSRKEMSKEEITKLLELIKANDNDAEKELTSLEIASYASPDGPEDMNQKLVVNRGNTAKKFITKELKKAKISKLDDANFITTTTTPDEDWEGFKNIVQGSSMADKDLILRVLSMYQDPVVREREIKNIAEAYVGLKGDVLPKLRRSVLKVNFKSKTKTESEIRALAESNPKSLSNAELLYAATLTGDMQKKASLYREAYTLYNSWEAHNNFACTQIAQGMYVNADGPLNRALMLGGNEGMIYNNLGVAAMAAGNEAKAIEYFDKAKAAGCTNSALGYNLGIINIKKAEYADAVTNFGATASFNKALAQLLNGDASAAESTMNGLGECKDGAFYYLKAIIAARLDKQADVISNLKTTIEKDGSYKAYALADREFHKLAGNALFTALLK